mgnify:CR=1 FL=1|tara:strand:- start:3668 stop:4306 length:639 start_codon:yes stop_codon:yes gene_type:complete
MRILLIFFFLYTLSFSSWGQLKVLPSLGFQIGSTISKEYYLYEEYDFKQSISGLTYSFFSSYNIFLDFSLGFTLTYSPISSLYRENKDITFDDEWLDSSGSAFSFYPIIMIKTLYNWYLWFGYGVIENLDLENGFRPNEPTVKYSGQSFIVAGHYTFENQMVVMIKIVSKTFTKKSENDEEKEFPITSNNDIYKSFSGTSMIFEFGYEISFF